MSESEVSCTGTYQVNEDLTYAETVACSGNVVAGGGAGFITFTQEPRTIHGRIHGDELMLSDTMSMPAIVLHVSTTPSPFYRLCAQSGTGVKIKKHKER